MVPITHPPQGWVARPWAGGPRGRPRAFEPDELLGVGADRSAELRGQARHDLQLIRDRIQRARAIVRGHRVSFGSATRREPRAWVSASIKNVFKLTFRSFAAARTRRLRSTGSLPTI